MRYQLTPVRMAIIKKQTASAGEDVKKREPSCSIGGIINCCGYYGKQFGGTTKKLKLELPYDPAIPLLGIYPTKYKTLIQKDTHTPMFTAVLFTITKIWKPPKCPSIDEWIKKMWYIFNATLLGHTKELNINVYKNMNGLKGY